MTRTGKTAALLALLFPGALWAQDVLDTNADGVITLDEVQMMHPDVDSESFMQADTDSDGLLNEEELAAAREAGLIPMADG